MGAGGVGVVGAGALGVGVVAGAGVVVDVAGGVGVAGDDSVPPAARSGCAQFEHQRASARLPVPQDGQRRGRSDWSVMAFQGWS